MISDHLYYNYFPIWLVILLNNSFTPSPDLADTSQNKAFSLIDNSFPSLKLTYLSSTSQSDLLPTTATIKLSGELNSYTYSNHHYTFSKVVLSSMA